MGLTGYDAAEYDSLNMEIARGLSEACLFRPSSAAPMGKLACDGKLAKPAKEVRSAP